MLLARKVFVNNIVADNCRFDLDHNHVRPTCTRIRQRGDVETCERVVRDLLKAGFDTNNVLLWLTLLHLLHSREATSTILAQVLKNKLHATQHVAAAIAELLDLSFTKAELQWDLKLPYFAGGSKFRMLAEDSASFLAIFLCEK